jgi:hypothetical protein
LHVLRFATPQGNPGTAHTRDERSSPVVLHHADIRPGREAQGRHPADYGATALQLDDLAVVAGFKGAQWNDPIA